MPLTRRLILQKARHHTQKDALTDCRHTVSGTISLPSRGTFHHSLTVLIHYRSRQVFRLTGWSRQIHSRFHEPAATREHAHNHRRICSATGLSPSTVGDPTPLRLTHTNNRDDTAVSPTHMPHNQPHATPAEYHTHDF